MTAYVRLTIPTWDVLRVAGQREHSTLNSEQLTTIQPKPFSSLNPEGQAPYTLQTLNPKPKTLNLKPRAAVPVEIQEANPGRMSGSTCSNSTSSPGLGFRVSDLGFKAWGLGF